MMLYPSTWWATAIPCERRATSWRSGQPGKTIQRKRKMGKMEKMEKMEKMAE